MPPRKAPPPLVPAVTVEVVPVDPDAGVTFADHRAASAMMLRALAGLDTAAALDRLRVLYASLPNGTARRAVLAARLAILRDDVPERMPVPVPPPVVVAPVAPKAPLKAGALSTLALEAAAKLLMEAGAAPPALVKTKPRKAKSGPMDAAAIAAMMKAEQTPEDVPPQDAPQDSPVFVPTPPPVMASPLSILSALDALPDEETVADLSAGTNAPPARPAFDLGAAFAAFDDDLGADAPVAPPADLTLTDDLTAMDAKDAPAKPKRRKMPVEDAPKDDIAASLSALIGEGDAPVAPPMPEAEVSERLTALDSPEADPAPTKPKRAKPTNLSDVSAAFAAMNNDDA
ncbi:MAG: hypothetical protein CFE34_10490 [Rhodobacteraceae bacterium PARR1]|nr:MAG: hypothetical protein CFE34_10490 [Rhodobacteraceae bacterium PARR1]